MNLSPDILGRGAVEKLQEREHASVLAIGSDRLTRGELAAVGCYNFAAAARLTRVLRQELQVKSLRQVYEEVPPSALALPELGAFSLATLGAAFEAKGIGGERPLESYVARHKKSGERPTTFLTMKHHQLEEQSREERERRQRKATRRRKAHHLRVARFEQRRAG